MEFTSLRDQYLSIEGEIKGRINKVLDHGQFIMGPEVFEFESAVESKLEVEFCSTCANGTDAISIALLSCGLENNDIVIVPAFSFFASAEAVLQVGARIRFADVNSSTYNLDPESLLRTINNVEKEGEKVFAVLAVGLFGSCLGLEQVSDICRSRSIVLVEDGAQSFGARVDGKYSHELCDAVTTSFFPSKPLGGYGDGGAIFSGNKKIAERAESLKQHGKGDHKYENISVGFNSRLDTIQAAILLEKIRLFDSELNRRKEIARIYSENIAHSEISTPNFDEGSAWAQYTLKSRCRDSFIEILGDRSIPTAIYYPVPLHRAKAFNGKYSSTDCREADLLSGQVFSIPIGAYMSDEDIELVVSTINGCRA